MVNPAGNTNEATLEISRQHERVAGYLQGMLAQTLPMAFIVLNAEREVVFANKAACALVEAEAEEQVLGRRFGDVANCIQSKTGEG